ncbi:hypothetical protein TNCV_3555071 [Trichonephila clavipes]|nr:hypothetical protein TNCV_3555071 [Trichonephila clavipes]
MIPQGHQSKRETTYTSPCFPLKGLLKTQHACALSNWTGQTSSTAVKQQNVNFIQTAANIIKIFPVQGTRKKDRLGGFLPRFVCLFKGFD